MLRAMACCSASGTPLARYARALAHDNCDSVAEALPMSFPMLGTSWHKTFYSVKDFMGHYEIITEPTKDFAELGFVIGRTKRFPFHLGYNKAMGV